MQELSAHTVCPRAGRLREVSLFARKGSASFKPFSPRAMSPLLWLAQGLVSRAPQRFPRHNAAAETVSHCLPPAIATGAGKGHSCRGNLGAGRFAASLVVRPVLCQFLQNEPRGGYIVSAKELARRSKRSPPARPWLKFTTFAFLPCGPMRRASYFPKRNGRNVHTDERVGQVNNARSGRPPGLRSSLFVLDVTSQRLA